MEKKFQAYNLGGPLLLPPDMRQWLPEGHLALFFVGCSQRAGPERDRAGVRAHGRGQPPYHPVMMVTLLLYAYCTGKLWSRRIERATYEHVALRVLAGLFVQVLRLCQAAGLVRLGHVALDGTKVKANASKHKAMSYERMCRKEKELEAEVAHLLEEAERVDAAEDAEYGNGQRGDKLPAELARRQTRLGKIREAKAALEAEARA